MKEIKEDKQMERYTMFVDWKNQYCQNDYTTQGNLQIQCNPYQITSGIFHRNRTKSQKNSIPFTTETKRTKHLRINLSKQRQKTYIQKTIRH